MSTKYNNNTGEMFCAILARLKFFLTNLVNIITAIQPT